MTDTPLVTRSIIEALDVQHLVTLFQLEFHPPPKVFATKTKNKIEHKLAMAGAAVLDLAAAGRISVQASTFRLVRKDPIQNACPTTSEMLAALWESEDGGGERDVKRLMERLATASSSLAIKHHRSKVMEDLVARRVFHPPPTMRNVITRYTYMEEWLFKDEGFFPALLQHVRLVLAEQVKPTMSLLLALSLAIDDKDAKGQCHFLSLLAADKAAQSDCEASIRKLLGRMSELEFSGGGEKNAAMLASALHSVKAAIIQLTLQHAV